ncbi:MAG: transposase, partial [Oscillospiraceae bacterium]
MKNDVCTAELATENAALKSKVFELEALVKYYEEQFRLAKHRQFGVSSEKSEYDFGQLCLFNEAELFSDPKVVEPELAAATKRFRERTRLT